MHQPMLVVFATSLLGGLAIHVGPVSHSLVPTTRLLPETSLVVPAGSRMLTYLAQPLSARSARPGDTIYLRVASALLVSGQVVIPAGSFVEATVSHVPKQVSGSRLGIALRLRHLIGAQGDLADIVALGGAPNDSAYRRGVTAVAGLPGRDQVVTMSAAIAVVVESAFTVDTRRSMASAFGRTVRVVGSPPRLECLVESAPATTDVRIPGTPPTPATGDLPGTPGTPDIVISGVPTVSAWQPCR